MPINFVTGLPRQGKTLFTFIQVQERAKKENRSVYYCNIPGVTLPGWTEVGHPDKWMDLPNDSIIIVDELQDFWGAASSGARVPLPILELSKHGKRGIDFYFITQDPTLVHATPRKLCETHWHVVRAFGSENAIAYKFRGMQTDPSKVANKAEKYPWRYPKEAFGKKDKAGNWITQPWYKSADVHNIKRQIPLKVWAIPLALAVAVGAAWFAISSVLSYGGKMADIAAGSVPGGAGVSGVSGPSGARPPSAPGVATRGPLTASQYVNARTPRIDGFPHTAPAFDDITKPVHAPRPAACVSMGKRCACYTQQGTLLQTSHEICVQIVERGYFMEWQEAPAQHAQQAQQANKPAAVAQQAQQAPSVRTVPMPEPQGQQPGQITQADIPHVLAMRRPSMQAHVGNVGAVQ